MVALAQIFLFFFLFLFFSFYDQPTCGSFLSRERMRSTVSFLSSSSSSSRRGKWNCPRTLHSEFTFTRNSRYGIPGKTAIESWSRSRFLPPFIHFCIIPLGTEWIQIFWNVKFRSFDRYFYLLRLLKASKSFSILLIASESFFLIEILKEFFERFFLAFTWCVFQRTIIMINVLK